jgi:glycosyltransferase involved in cell wall biosynthesis
VTLTPTEGIGVFVWNLIGGLMELVESVEVVVLVAPGDQHLVEPLQRRYPGRLHVIPPSLPRVTGFPFAARPLETGIRFIARVRRKVQGLNRRIQYWQKKVRARTFPNPSAQVLEKTLRSWGYFKTTLAKVLTGFRLVLDQFRPFLFVRGKLEAILNPLVVCRNAGCDVWLIPSDRFRFSLVFPSVLVIHDLVHIHYPDAVPDDVRWELEKLVPARAAEATLCACMSAFIRDADLRGVLGLPADKIRMIRPAPPADFTEVTRAEAARLKPTRLTRPYLFYPAAFRSYKNHSALVEALDWLHHSMGDDSFDLVFTGIHALPRTLARKISDLNLRDRIHVLGCVDRRTLAALYRCAFATIVPSLYEQGSFPIYEALHWGCPVACSTIPSLVEQCEPLGDAMIYFDAQDPPAIARAILRIRDDRESIRNHQVIAAQNLLQRT